MILRKPAQGLAGMGQWEAVLADPRVQQAATQTAGDVLSTVGSGLVSLFGGGDSPAPTPPPPPPQPLVPSWVPIAALGGLGLLLYLRRK